MLLVEDEPNLLLLLGRVMRGAGYEVFEASTGAEGVRLAGEIEPDIVLLDLMLPDLTGEAVLETLLERRPRLRVLVLSAVTDTGRRVRVLDSGAVDFVSKPFAIAELLARIRARSRTEPGDDVAGQHCVRAFGLELDMEHREVQVDGRRIQLSQREFLLLAHLLRHAPQACTRQELLSEVWGLGFDPGTNVLDVCVRRLRGKMQMERIETVRNVGYRLVAV